jgi:hypothetical protein
LILPVALLAASTVWLALALKTKHGAIRAAELRDLLFKTTKEL